MKKSTMNRRDFIKMSSVSLAAPSIVLSGCGGGGGSGSSPSVGPTPPPTVPSPTPGGGLVIKQQDRALVYLMLGGGNDSYNMLVPNTDTAYTEYTASRSNLALSRNSLLALGGYKDNQNRTFALHPAMAEMRDLFQSGRLAFIANTAPLIQPITKAQYLQNSAPLPVGLMSHADQFRHWQTDIPGQRVDRGWFGKMADVLQKDKPDDQLAMGISLAGSNILQNGVASTEYAINQKGSVGLTINEQRTDLDKALFKSFNQMLNRSYDESFKKTYLDILSNAQNHHERFRQAIDKVNPTTAFSDTELSQQFKMVARSIAASAELGLPQKTFFLHYYGWDHHDELLNNHNRMLTVVSKALSEFQTTLQELNVADRTVTFTGSDFGRTLTSNGNGTDHGWGGHMIVMGEPVAGGRIYGEYPSLALGNELDIGNGVLIPTTAIDTAFAEMALWFGVEKDSLSALLPNIHTFYPKSSTAAPLGFIKS